MNADSTALEQVRRLAGVAVHCLPDTRSRRWRIADVEQHLARLAVPRGDGQAAPQVVFVLGLAVYPGRASAAAARDDAVNGQGRVGGDWLLIEDIHFTLTIKLLAALRSEEKAAERLLLGDG
ncbi:MAG: hypothetical protein CRU78_17135 [Candidatus Accumulibacter phosphatis]|uniref:Uncharacterized protein n=1 Tax=Candidatus Accumulibacter phosphatis TaxID=327160 RepID=A0A6A7RYE2_9PROT|nr:hypothetical protein [Candidatus Accumulibacter phosphatis]